MLLRVLLLLAAVAVILVSCGDDTTPTAPNQPQSIAEYLWFDTTSILRIYSSSAHDNTGETYYVDGDSIIGEPFIDNNGNGIYDPGIDGFVMAADPTVNMDFNRNGRYDGPNDPYYIGEPYADYNQNGVYDTPDQSYDIGEPFFDMNGNGVLDFIPGSCVCGKWDHDSTGATYSWHYCDTVAEWISPLGEAYVFPPWQEIWDFANNETLRHPFVTFHAGTDGLQYREYMDLRIPLADADNPVTGRSNVIVAAGPDTSISRYYSTWRTIEFGQSIQIDTTLYDNLLRIRVDSFRTGDGQLIDWIYYEFYFSKDLGLLAASWDDETGSEGYFQRFGAYDSIPRPMIRDTVQP